MPDVAHLHLLLNHLPVLGTLFSLLLLLYGLFRKSNEVARAALIGIVLSGIGGFAAEQTGEGAEEVIERLPGISHQLIHAHEDSAELATKILLALTIAVVVLLFKYRKQDLPRKALYVVVVVSAIVAGLMFNTAYDGGKIRHTEIHGTPPPKAEDDH